MSDSSKWSTAVCPIGLASELACDEWLPIILRDIGPLERRIFNQLLKHNQEGISSGSLETKLRRLEHVGLITSQRMSTSKRNCITLQSQGLTSCRCYLPWQDGPQSGINRALSSSRPLDLIYRRQNLLCLTYLLSCARRIWNEKKLDPMPWMQRDSGIVKASLGPDTV